MPHSLHSPPSGGDSESEVSAGGTVSQDVETFLNLEAWRSGLCLSESFSEDVASFKDN